MPRKRMIDPAIWTDEKFGALSVLSKLLFIGLVSNADDDGRGNASSNYLKAVLLPYDVKVSVKSIESACDEIAKTMNIVFYRENETSKTHYQILKFHDWQTINRPTPSKIPQYDESVFQRVFSEHSLSNHGTLTPNRIEVKLIEDKRIEKNIYSESFERLWKEYPKNAGSSKSKAYASFEKLNLDDETLEKIFASIRILKDTKQWLDGYVPHLATFLNQKRWESVVEDTATTKKEADIDLDKMLDDLDEWRGDKK